ncbi:MAG: C25 family cysteine peptidase [Algoriphagus sp.]|nr:C25 family cysteine peptidase [Algoriphagus sp.]
MRKSFVLFFLGFYLNSISMAQDSVWYRYDLTYYKIQTAEDGIYRIPSASLSAAGLSLQGKDPRFFRLYHRGKEVAFWIAGEQDGRLDSEDYLDFWGKKNEQWRNSRVEVPNPYVDTYSDTTAFFLVYTPGERGKRMDFRAPLPASDPFEAVQLQVYAEEYSLGEMLRWGLRSSSLKVGQGWMSSVIASSRSLEFQLDTAFTTVDSQSISLELGWVGRSLQEHVPMIWLGTSSQVPRALPSPQFSEYESHRQFLVLQEEDLQDAKLKLHLGVDPTREGDYFSLAFARLTYLLPKTKANTGPAPHRSTVESLQAVRFRDYEHIAADYLIVGHGQLELPSQSYSNPLQAFAAYRASEAGGSYGTLVLRMENLYDQFAFGEKTPLALQAFLQAYWPKHQPKYLLLAGRALIPYGQTWVKNAAVFQRNAPQAFAFHDLVPTGGFPPSDSQFVRGLNLEDPALAAMAVGRIPAKNAQELADYLDKVKEKELLETPGPQKILHLVGGLNPVEIERHRNFLEVFAALAKSGDQAVEVKTQAKQEAAEVQSLNLSQEINTGLALLTYFGHGSLGYNELDFGFVSDPALGYANVGVYPLLLINGCAYGDAFGASYSQGEDWLITPKKGAIAVLSNSSLGVDLLLKRSSELLYQGLFDWEESACTPTLGEILLQAEREFIGRYGQRPEHLAHWAQLILLGDPALRLFSCKSPNNNTSSGTR